MATMTICILLLLLCYVQEGIKTGEGEGGRGVCTLVCIIEFSVRDKQCLLQL